MVALILLGPLMVMGAVGGFVDRRNALLASFLKNRRDLWAGRLTDSINWLSPRGHVRLLRHHLRLGGADVSRRAADAVANWAIIAAARAPPG